MLAPTVRTVYGPGQRRPCLKACWCIQGSARGDRVRYAGLFGGSA